MTVPPTSKLPPEDLDEIYAFAVGLGKRAGKILLDGVQNRIDGVGTATDTAAGSTGMEFTEKDNAVDIVTQVDEGTYSLRLGVIIRLLEWNHCRILLYSLEAEMFPC